MDGPLAGEMRKWEIGVRWVTRTRWEERLARTAGSMGGGDQNLCGNIIALK